MAYVLRLCFMIVNEVGKRRVVFFAFIMCAFVVRDLGEGRGGKGEGR